MTNDVPERFLEKIAAASTREEVAAVFLDVVEALDDLHGDWLIRIIRRLGVQASSVGCAPVDRATREWIDTFVGDGWDTDEFKVPAPTVDPKEWLVHSRPGVETELAKYVPGVRAVSMFLGLVVIAIVLVSEPTPVRALVLWSTGLFSVSCLVVRRWNLYDYGQTAYVLALALMIPAMVTVVEVVGAVFMGTSGRSRIRSGYGRPMAHSLTPADLCRLPTFPPGVRIDAIRRSSSSRSWRSRPPRSRTETHSGPRRPGSS